MAVNPQNLPLDQLSDDALINLVVALGVFSTLCRESDPTIRKYSLKRLLMCSAKLYDMNLLKIRKYRGKYHVKTSDLPVSIVDHLMSIDKDTTFLPPKTLLLIDKFVKITKSDNIPKKARKPTIGKKKTNKKITKKVAKKKITKKVVKKIVKKKKPPKKDK